MSFELLDRTFGPAYAGFTAVIIDPVMSARIRIYTGPNGGLASSEGESTLDQAGRLRVYVGGSVNCVIKIYDRAGRHLRTDYGSDTASEIEVSNSATSVAFMPTTAQQEALSAGGGTGGGVVVVDGSGIMYDAAGNPIAGDGGGSTPLAGTLTSTATTSALRADQGPVITALVNTKYTKPGTGVPVTDLATTVQASLGSADTALQPAGIKTVNGNSLIGSGNVTIAAASNMTGATSGAAGTAGLVPAPAAGDQAKVLSGAGTWITPAASVPVMTGANGVVAGAAGTVPPPAATDNVNFLRGDGTWAAVSAGASAPVRTSINVTANGQTGKMIVTGYGTSAQAATITATASGAGDNVTINVPAGFLLKTATFNCPAGFNTGTAFMFTYKDPYSSTADISDAVVPSIWLYNGAYVIQTQTNILVTGAAGGMVSIQKTGLTASTNYVWNLKVL